MQEPAPPTKNQKFGVVRGGASLSEYFCQGPFSTPPQIKHTPYNNIKAHMHTNLYNFITKKIVFINSNWIFFFFWESSLLAEMLAKRDLIVFGN